MTQFLDFKEISNRDAWSTIRGFVYQVDYTILRWLELNENDILELERGEDIDIIQRDLANQEISRDLEQIKYRAESITLNTDITFELLQNFYNHRINNPGKNIRFRFLTNAKYGQERPTIFTEGDKGIERWISLYDPETDWENNKTASALKHHIQNRIKEQIQLYTGKVTEEQRSLMVYWQGFHDYLDNIENLRSFLSNFEWANDKLDQFTIVTLVLSKLQQIFNPNDSRAIYERLFVFIFKLLSKNGVKSLNKESLDSQVRNTIPDPADQKLVAILKALLSEVDQRLLNLENKSDEQTKALNKVFKDLDILRNDTLYSHRLQHISTSSPEVIQHGSVRTEKVKMIAQFLELLPWVAFQGINGSGKTQLASLVSRSYRDVFWLDLREYHADLRITASAIEGFLSLISGIQLQTEKQRWVDLVVDNLPEGCLIVFNDVPNLDNSVPGLNESFCYLIHALDRSTIKLITTSNWAFPDAIIQQCPEDCVFVYDDFDFDDEEISEYLVNQGAPKEFLRMIPFVAARAHRNPRLTTAMINHLKNINWGLDSGQLLETVMKTEFAAGVLEDAQQSIIKYIGDESSKNLLYRLSLIDWAFGMEQVHAVSKVESQIFHPGEKMQPLLHLWIQLTEHSKFEISPIIKDIGIKNLDQESVSKVHIAVGKSIIAGKKINLITGNRALVAFISAKDYNSAGLVLLKMYEASVTLEQAKIMYNAGYLFFWTSTDFPGTMSLGMKIMIRREQLRLYELTGMDIKKLLEQSKRLFEEDNITVIEAATIRMLLLTNYFLILPVEDYLDYMSFVLQNLEEIGEIVTIFQDGTMLSNMIWLPAMRLSSKAEVESWIALVKLATEKGVDTLGSDLGGMSLGALCHGIFKREIFDHDDETGIAMYNGLLDFLTKEKRQELAVYVVRGLAEVESRWHKDPENAVKLISHYLSEYTHPHAIFVLNGQLARIYKQLGDKEMEIEYLNKAFSYEANDHIELIDLFTQAAVAVAENDRQMAVDYCQKAVDNAKAYPTYGETDLILLLDELAVALWLKGAYEQMFQVFEEVVTRLFKTIQANPESQWMRLFCLTGHVVGYCSAIINEGKPPQTGGEDFFDPYQGMFNYDTKDYSDFYKPRYNSYMLVQMAYLALGLGDKERAYQWSIKAFDEARSNGAQDVFTTISSVASHFAIVNFKPTEAFEEYLYNGAIMSHFKGKPEDRHERLKDLSGETIFSEKPSLQWAEAEDTATTFATIPLFIMLLTAFKHERFEKNQMRAVYFKMLTTFESNASDELLFDLVKEISQKILDNKISTETLGSRANTFGQQERRNLQTLCLLGVIHLTRNEEERLSQMINIIPYAQKILSATKNSLEYTLVPFVLVNAIDIVKTHFVGSKDELAEIEAEIYNVDRKDKKCLRNIINIARKLINVAIPDDRQEWLNGSEI